MDTNLIKQNVYKLSSSNVSFIYLFDIFKDELFKYKFLNDQLQLIETKNISEYLSDINSLVKEEYVKEYMNMISIPKLEEELKQGNDKIDITYKTINNTSVHDTATLIDYNSNKAILVVSCENDSVKTDGKIEGNVKYNSLVDTLSDGIIKIKNLFDLKESKENIDSTFSYIDSVFSNLISSFPELKTSFNKTYANVSGRSQDVILIVDDDTLTRNMIKKIFNDEYKTVMASNGKEAIEYLEKNEEKGMNSSTDHVIGIFLDLAMPVMDGFSVLDYLSKNNYLNTVPVIIISGDYEKETKMRVYNYNIADMLEKPFDFDVVRHRISNFINLYKSSNSLNNIINGENNNLKDIINPVIDSYLKDYNNNINNINKYIKILSKKLKDDYPEFELTDEKIEKMADSSKYYDIGLYSVPKSLISNNNQTTESIDYIKKYPLHSEKLVSYLLSLTSDSLYKNYAINICKYYHENYNGTGYPLGIKEDKIPLEAQIAKICILYNNLKNSIPNISDYLKEKKNVMFNPKIVDSFINVINQM